jgi:hypothetical protein
MRARSPVGTAGGIAAVTFGAFAAAPAGAGAQSPSVHAAAANAAAAMPPGRRIQSSEPRYSTRVKWSEGVHRRQPVIAPGP